MSKKNHPIYKLKFLETWDAGFGISWTRVPGGWAVVKNDESYPAASWAIFVPYNEEFLEELR